MKRLTRRQREFLSKFLDLYDEGRVPLRYEAMAEHLGVGKISAYEMLRLLEDRGLVEAEYQLQDEPRGPGRPQPSERLGAGRLDREGRGMV